MRASAARGVRGGVARGYFLSFASQFFLRNDVRWAHGFAAGGAFGGGDGAGATGFRGSSGPTLGGAPGERIDAASVWGSTGVALGSGGTDGAGVVEPGGAADGCAGGSAGGCGAGSISGAALAAVAAPLPGSIGLADGSAAAGAVLCDCTAISVPARLSDSAAAVIARIAAVVFRFRPSPWDAGARAS